MARAHGARAQMALAFESTYGTVPAGGYIQMPFASAGLGAGQGLIDSELVGYGRDPLPPAKDVVTVDGNVVIPIDVEGIGHWLKLLLGAPTTTGTSPKIHTFISGATTLPSASIEIANPEVPSFRMYSGVRADTLQVSLERSGNLQATLGLIGQGEAEAGATAAGTPSTFSLTRYGHFQGAIKRDGVSLGNITSGDFTFSNGLDRIETIRADGKIDGADPGMSSLKGKISTRFADNTLKTQAQNGTPCELEFSWLIDASRSLKITAHAVYLPVPRVEIPGPSGIMADYDWQAARATSPARMMTAVLVNSVASY